MDDINDNTDLESLDLEGRLEKHPTHWDEFDKLQSKIEDLSVTQKEQDEDIKERISFENLFHTISGIAKKYF